MTVRPCLCVCLRGARAGSAALGCARAENSAHYSDQRGRRPCALTHQILEPTGPGVHPTDSRQPICRSDGAHQPSCICPHDVLSISVGRYCISIARVSIRTTADNRYVGPMAPQPSCICPHGFRSISVVLDQTDDNNRPISPQQLELHPVSTSTNIVFISLTLKLSPDIGMVATAVVSHDS